MKAQFDYIAMINNVLNDPDLSLKAKALYFFILFWDSYNPRMPISIKSFSAYAVEGERSVRGGLNELIKADYIELKQTKMRGQYQGIQYIIKNWIPLS